jgi:hypothetical protein
MSYRWGPDGPPKEAYSRVTDAERFRPLHAAALRMLEELERTFAVERTEGTRLDPELEGGVPPSHATVRLAPLDPAAAPITVAFTSFPGLRVRAGRWLVRGFPSCGCDACDETAEGEIERLRELVADVTGGRFTESVSLPLAGSGWYEHVLGARWADRGRSRLTRSRARELIGSGRRRIEWAAWRAAGPTMEPRAI